MRCEEAAEFVSALCDGEVIPQNAAEHINGCNICRERLHSYVTMGADLRCEASVVLMNEVPAQTWERRRVWWRDVWQKGWESMRVPRWVFAGMLAGIVVLGSGLAVVRARTRSVGNVILLKMTPTGQQPMECALSTVGEKEKSCAYMDNKLGFKVSALSKDGERAKLGIRAKYRLLKDGKSLLNTDDLENVPEETYEFEPGDTLRVNVPGFGEIAITGSWIDHMPAMIGVGDSYDPGPSEVRIISPLLLRDKQVIGDMEGGSAISDRSGEYVDIYWPGEGRYEFSLSPMPGAVQAQVKLNRVTFDVDGGQYLLVTGAPIARDRQIWARRDTGYKPSSKNLADGFIGTGRLSDLKASRN